MSRATGVARATGSAVAAGKGCGRTPTPVQPVPLQHRVILANDGHVALVEIGTRDSSTERPATGRSSQPYRFGAGKRCVTSTCSGEALFVVRRGGVFNRVCQRRS